MGVTPVPIPNTMVKTQAADGTALETVWESRWLPEFEKRKLVLPVIRELKRFNFLMADKTVKCLHCTSRTSFFRSRAGTL